MTWRKAGRSGLARLLRGTDSAASEDTVPTTEVPRSRVARTSLQEVLSSVVITTEPSQEERGLATEGAGVGWSPGGEEDEDNRANRANQAGEESSGDVDGIETVGGEKRGAVTTADATDDLGRDVVRDLAHGATDDLGRDASPEPEASVDPGAEKILVLELQALLPRGAGERADGSQGGAVEGGAPAPADVAASETTDETTFVDRRAQAVAAQEGAAGPQSAATGHGDAYEVHGDNGGNDRKDQNEDEAEGADPQNQNQEERKDSNLVTEDYADRPTSGYGAPDVAEAAAQGRAQASAQSFPQTSGAAHVLTLTPTQPQRQRTQMDNPIKTQMVRGGQQPKRTDFYQEPVVGWLVVIGGPGLGAFRPIFEGNNTIGRSPSQRIPLDFGDDAISAEEQAYIRYDSADREFLFVPNLAKTNVVQINEEKPTTPVKLQAMDVITMGRTQFVFVPFCGEEFDWSELSDLAG